MNLLNGLLIISLSKGQIACSVPKWMVFAGKSEVDFQIFEVAEWEGVGGIYWPHTWGMCESGGT